MINRAACCVSTLVLMAVALPALAVNDFNSSRSNREKGTLAVSPPAPGASSGDEEAQAVQQAQDFNTTRSNKERGATKRVLPTVNKRTTATDGVDQDCDGTADDADRSSSSSSSTCPVAPPASSSAKVNKTGHVTLNR
jgi:hypothetical protein